MKKKSLVGWMCFCDGKPIWWGDNQERVEIFKTKREASQLSIDVRKIQVKEIK